MRPKNSRKRKANGGAPGYDGNVVTDTLSIPSRETWPGWVEMESEPAFFNVMLRDMGVHGAKIQEVYCLDDDMLATLPQPVYALIFLFRYHSEDHASQDAATENDHIWFANQLPEFACATVALLNIVNNISDLTLGPELRQFKEFTKDMSPVLRGDAIDSFDFIRRIHNSFARENDLLTADMHIKDKFEKAKKQASTAKARATKEAKKKQQASFQTNGESLVKTSSRRTPPSPQSSANKPSTPNNDPPFQPISQRSQTDVAADDEEYQAGKNPELQNGESSVRRSKRTPKPRQNLNGTLDANTESEDEQGFHFVAYMPIEDRVWKLDGLDRFPYDLGTYKSGISEESSEDLQNGGITSNWIHVAAPAIQARMAQFEGNDIQFNLMAVVHNPLAKEREELVKNVKALQIVDSKLTGIAEDWYEMDGAETKKDVIVGITTELGITQPDIDKAKADGKTEENIAAEEDMLKLIEIRQSIISQQSGLRGALKDSMMGSKEDDEKAKHRRHDYRAFVRGWLEALADAGMLEAVLKE